MAHQASERYEVSRTGMQLYVPAVVRERFGVDYNDEVRVTLHLNRDYVSDVSFEAFICSNGCVTIPVALRRKFDLPDDPTVSFEATGEAFDVSRADGTVRTTIYIDAHSEKPLEAVTDIVNRELDNTEKVLGEFEEALAEMNE